MHEKWVKPDFVTVCVNGECTAYAGAEEVDTSVAVSSGFGASEMASAFAESPAGSGQEVAPCGKGVV